MRTLRSITISAMLLSILLAQEYALMGIPNVSLTAVLLMVYAVLLPWGILLPMTISYVLLDNLIMGSMNIFYFVPMLFVWLVLVVVTKRIQSKSLGVLVAWGTFFGFFYGWVFAIPQVVLTGVDLWVYLLADLPFDVIFAINNLVTISLLFPPLIRSLRSLMTSKTSEPPEL